MAYRVLIADDEPAIATSLEFLLNKGGYDTQIARDGEVALRAAKTFNPDLIVLDLMLPRLSGLEVCMALRATPQSERLKILMLSARGGASERERARVAGVDAYQVKPFSTKELLAQVRDLLAGVPIGK
ncbi:MAG: response regulator [Betaproteobacteria bacterium]